EFSEARAPVLRGNGGVDQTELPARLEHVLGKARGLVALGGDGYDALPREARSHLDQCVLLFGGLEARHRRVSLKKDLRREARREQTAPTDGRQSRARARLLGGVRSAVSFPRRGASETPPGALISLPGTPARIRLVLW